MVESSSTLNSPGVRPYKGPIFLEDGGHTVTARPGHPLSASQARQSLDDLLGYGLPKFSTFVGKGFFGRHPYDVSQS